MKQGLPTPTVTVHESLSDVIVIRGSGPRSEFAESGLPEVIVGRGCGQAVLRGAEVYAPGVVGMPTHVAAGDKVGIASRVVNPAGEAHSTQGSFFLPKHGSAFENGLISS